MRKISSFLLFSFLLAAVVVVKAEDVSTDREISLDRSQNVKVAAQERKEERQEKRASTAGELKARREAFKEKLKTIKDQRKQKLVERIDAKLVDINKRRTAHMVKILDKLASIAARLEAKISTAEAAGKDVTAARAAIEKANDAITTAQSTVSSQAGKEYVITIGQESGLKGTVGETMSQLQADLRTTHKVIIDAKQAVMNAAREVKKLQGDKSQPTGTSSAEPQ